MEHEPRLSAEQAAVVRQPVGTGHLLILARPGSGKTHTLAARARHLVANDVAPPSILAMTFSRRAALELKDRLPGGDIWAGTFHAICADILERHGAAIGVSWPFGIVDEVRGLEFISLAAADLGLALPAERRQRNHALREIAASIELTLLSGRLGYSRTMQSRRRSGIR